MEGYRLWWWQAGDFAELTGDQLAVLCKLMGIPFTGTKAEKGARLLVAANLRGILACYDRPGQMTAFFSGTTLRKLCKQAGCYAGSTKHGMCAALLNWRDTCRQAGQEFQPEARAAARQARELQPRLF